MKYLWKKNLDRVYYFLKSWLGLELERDDFISKVTSWHKCDSTPTQHTREYLPIKTKDDKYNLFCIDGFLNSYEWILFVEKKEGPEYPLSIAISPHEIYFIAKGHHSAWTTQQIQRVTHEILEDKGY